MTLKPQSENEKTGAVPAAPVSVFMSSVAGRCPACGQGPLFKGLLTLVDTCELCEFSFEKADPGDGPAVFVILILGAVTAVLAFLIEGIFAPSVLFHIMFWPIFISAAGLWLLRVFKATLIALQFKHDAGEAQLDSLDSEDG